MNTETETAPTRRRTKRRGRHPHQALAPAFVRTAPPGHHIDGNGLYLYVQPTGARSWIQRLVIRGRRCELGLGSVALVTLAEAREQAVANRKLARSGGDPLADKRRVQGLPTFAEAATAVIDQKRAGWKTPEQAQAWRGSLERYAFPRIGRRPISEVASADVLAILTPIWHTKPVIAKAVKQRIHTVLEWAIAMNLRTDNPSDRVGPVLGPPAQHRAAHAGVATPGGRRGARHRAGVGRESGRHARVRVSGADGRAVGRGPLRRVGRDGHDGTRVDHPGHADEDEARAPGASVRARAGDPCRRPGRSATARSCSPAGAADGWISSNCACCSERCGIAAVPHGFRSSFRDWAAEETDHPREVIEAALAHAVGNKVEAAYARSDLFARRRRLMDDWAAYLDRQASTTHESAADAHRREETRSAGYRGQ